MSIDPQAFYKPNIVILSGTSKLLAQDEFVREHILCHIYSGELRFTLAESETVSHAGETILFRRDLLFKCEKRPAADGRPFRIAFWVFERGFLEEYAVKHVAASSAGRREHRQVLFVKPRVALQSVISGMEPYIETGEVPSRAMIGPKLEEALVALEEQGLGDWLFTQDQPGKIDLEAFMQRNYKFNVPMTKFASLSGRSLSTFQRDFQKIFGVNPTVWLLKRRLQAAYEAISSGRSAPVDIYLELGFEDIAHFSRSFKHAFGINASALFKAGRDRMAEVG
jgi:AraC-like DNA-binding protein